MGQHVLTVKFMLKLVRSRVDGLRLSSSKVEYDELVVARRGRGERRSSREIDAFFGVDARFYGHRCCKIYVKNCEELIDGFDYRLQRPNMT
jgi:hypothetical protein